MASVPVAVSAISLWFRFSCLFRALVDSSIMVESDPGSDEPWESIMVESDPGSDDPWDDPWDARDGDHSEPSDKAEPSDKNEPSEEGLLSKNTHTASLVTKFNLQDK